MPLYFNGATKLSGLNDVNVTEGAGIDGKPLTYQNSSSKWIAGTAATNTLAGLSDVNVTEGAGIDGKVLTWQNSSSKWIATTGGGGSTAIGLTSGAGYPKASATVGDIYRATDGWPGALLYSYLGSFTGMPTVVNFGSAAITATGSISVSLKRATTIGNILVAVVFNVATSQVSIASGWTSIISNNTPTPAISAAWQTIASSSSTAAPYSASNANGIVLILEIANAASSGTIAGSASGPGASRVCTTGNLLIVAEGIQESLTAGYQGSPFTYDFTPPGAMWGGLCSGPGTSPPALPVAGRIAGLPILSATTPGNGDIFVAANMVGALIEIAAGASAVNLWESIR